MRTQKILYLSVSLRKIVQEIFGQSCKDVDRRHVQDLCLPVVSISFVGPLTGLVLWEQRTSSSR